MYQHVEMVLRQVEAHVKAAMSVLQAVEFHHPKPQLARQASISAGPSLRVPGLGHTPSQSNFHLPLSLLPQPIAALPHHLGHGLAAIPGVILPDFVQDTAGGLGHLLSGVAVAGRAYSARYMLSDHCCAMRM